MKGWKEEESYQECKPINHDTKGGLGSYLPGFPTW